MYAHYKCVSVCVCMRVHCEMGTANEALRFVQKSRLNNNVGCQKVINFQMKRVAVAVEVEVEVVPHS